MNAKPAKLLACAAGGICIAMLLAAALLSPKTNGRGVGAVAMSRASGFYDAPFDLELSFDGRIYYTLDSSDPDENAIPYEGPIHITDASVNPNVYAMITDVCLEYQPEQIAHSGKKLHFGFQLPEQPVDKCTVVRAVGIDGNGNRSDVTTGVYFVGFQEKTGYQGMGIISITTDPENLFGFEKGIYVLGKTFADCLEDDGLYPITKDDYVFWQSNYRKHGIDWEREANICCFDADRNVLFSGNYGIRIQGRVSRAFLPKSFNLFARSRYGSTVFSGMDLFGENWQLGSLNLHSGAHAIVTKLNDYLINDLVKDLDIDTRIYRPFELFLDGEYWGVYWLTPRYEKEYFQYKYGVQGDEVVQIKEKSVEIGNEDDEALYKAFVSFVTGHDMKDPAQYAQACALFDLESCIDYYATEIYIANHDWPRTNYSMWRTRQKGGGACGDGKWRWILFDVNMAMTLSETQADTIAKAKKYDKVFRHLMKNTEFANALTDKLVELADNTFNPARVEARIREYEAFMADAIENEYARYYNNTKSVEDFISKCENKIRFFYERNAYIKEMYGDGRVVR